MNRQPLNACAVAPSLKNHVPLPPLAGVLGLAAIITAVPACQRLQTKTTSSYSAIRRTFHLNKLAEIDAAIRDAITNKQCPGAVLWLERNGVAYARAYGWRAILPEKEAMSVDTIFDAASLTKVVATTPAVMLLVERGQLNLDAPVSAYLPEFTGSEKEKITLRQLLTHTSGLRPDVSLRPDWRGIDDFIRVALAEPLQAQPGQKFIYSDTGMILAGEI
ncbi:MAG: beta-lactamase family protein, partial [Verrucomicrobiae bacterium]|nr:beta-lactamase family protein [Verrucomicrobiae bacterium]